ncbi:TPA: hypothetical protein ACJI3N_000634 [Raoultella planticola]
MTDTTELAQSLKAAAKKAIAEEGSTWWNEEQLASDYGLALHRTDAKFIALASHENVLALVEALEKAQRANAAQDYHINQQQGRIEQLEKGQQHAAKHINNWRRLAKQNIAEREKEISELEAARGRIAELESRTVKLPRWLVKDAIAVYDRDEIEDALTAAGIKWEAE